jgi:hypothetical protein
MNLSRHLSKIYDFVTTCAEDFHNVLQDRNSVSGITIIEFSDEKEGVLATDAESAATRVWQPVGFIFAAIRGRHQPNQKAQDQQVQVTTGD